jgi:hypothetical protein
MMDQNKLFDLPNKAIFDGTNLDKKDKRGIYGSDFADWGYGFPPFTLISHLNNAFLISLWYYISLSYLSLIL